MGYDRHRRRFLTTRNAVARFALACLVPVLVSERANARNPDGRLELTVVDAESGEPIPARIHLGDGRDRTVKSRGWGHAALDDHAYLDGPAALELRKGPYRFDLDAGPEYRTRAGHFTIERHADDTERIEMRRFADLAEEGWLGADLQSARSKEDLPLLLRASQTALASSIGYRRDDGGWAPIDRRAKGLGSDALWVDPRGVAWLIDPSGELPLARAPLTAKALQQASDQGWRVLASASSWELPVWLAHGVVDGVIVLDGWAESKAGRRADSLGKRGDKIVFPGQRGAGRWREHVYEQMLEVGLRVPLVAGSGSGLNDTPFGDARVYASTHGDTDWWDALDDNRVFVTNGPLLRASIRGEPPGSTFPLPTGETIELEIALNLATRDPVDYLEILQNGEVLHSVRLAEWAKRNGRLPKVRFSGSGWVAVRAVTDRQERYQFARTAPFWVESSQGPRIDSGAVNFFLDWLEEAAERFEREDPEAYAFARKYWRERLAETND